MKRRRIRTRYYTTAGPVAGECGHRHPDLEAAARCLARHRQDQPDTDRRLVEVAR